MQEGIQTGEVKPLPVTIFTRAKAEDAFRFMATGQWLLDLPTIQIIYQALTILLYTPHASWF